MEPQNNKIAVCQIDGEFTVKRIKIEENIVWLIAENEDYKPIKVIPENDFMIWGIVTNCIKISDKVIYQHSMFSLNKPIKLIMQ